MKMLYGDKDDEVLYHKKPIDAAMAMLNDIRQNGEVIDGVMQYPNINVYEFKQRKLEVSDVLLDDIIATLDDEYKHEYDQSIGVISEPIKKAWDTFVGALKQHYHVSLYERTGKVITYECDGNRLSAEKIWWDK